jgi:hypothetical protein
MTMTRKQVCELIANALRATGESATPDEMERMRTFLEDLDAAQGNPRWPLLLRRMLDHRGGRQHSIARR